MSIFKQTFSPNIKKQLEVRQEALLKRDSTSIQYLNARTAWVRMCSSVNVGGSSELAKANVLLGGSLYNNKSLRAGVGTTADKAYSTQTPSGTPHRLGMRPMPGITNIDIKSKSAYGSLREVTIHFNCWDIKQLEDLELLYMRPNYSVLLEWGWMPYLDNNGKLYGTPSFIDDVLNGGLTKEEVWRKTYLKSAETGNYDSIYGFVTQYSWSARPDGGYDCSTTLITMGELIESIKVNYGAQTTTVAENGLFGILDKSNFGKDKPISKSYSQCFLAGMFDEIYRTVTKGGIENYKSKQVKLKDELYTFFSFTVQSKKEQATENQETTFPEEDVKIYIRLKDLISLINKYVTLHDEQGKQAMVEISLTEAAHSQTPGKDLLCLGNIYQISTDPTVCLIGNSAYGPNPNSLGIETSDAIRSIVNGLCETNEGKYWYDSGNAIGDTGVSSKQLAVIGNIFVNLGYLYSLVVNDELSAQDKKEKKEIALFDFLKNMMTGINTAIGNVANFDIHVDPIDSIARIIDVNYVDETSRVDAYNNAFILEMHNLKSTVRSYKLESQIFPEQSATIAIGAQAKGGALGTGDNTLVDFNQNLEDRIVPKKVLPPPISAPDDIKQQLQNLKDNLQLITDYFSDLSGGGSGLFSGWFGGGGEFDTSKSSQYSGALRDIINYYRTTTADSNNNRSIIPTKLSIELDGIGGLIIGNIFRIPNDLLPRGYKGDGAGPAKIGYVVTGLGGSIGNNNDWVSKIEAQFIILDEPKGFDPAEALKIIAKTFTIVADVDEVSDQTANDVKNLTPPPPPKGGSQNAMLQATNAIYNGGNGQSGKCARYTYNIARDYISAAKGGTTKGLIDAAGGNANDAAYRARLQSLGYSVTHMGTISRAELSKLINNSKWGVGDIINYCNKGTGGSDSSKIYGHTQIYTAGVQQKSNGVTWTSSVPANYGTSLVYRSEGPWDVYVLRSPV